MRLIVTLAASAALLLTPTAVLAQTPDVRTVTGVVTTFVEEGRAAPHQAIATEDELVPVAGTALEEHSTVTAQVEDVPGTKDQVVEVLASEPAPGPTAPAAVEHEVYVAFVAPAGTSLTDSMPSVAGATALVDDASDYWASQTGGQVAFRVAGTVPKYASSYACSQPWELWDEATDRFADPVTGRNPAVGPNKHVLLVLPASSSRAGCAAGMASLGSSVNNGGWLYASAHSTAIYAHELGHNMGLDHSGSLLCSGRQDAVLLSGGAAPSGCRKQEYDDHLDVMSSAGGDRGTGSLNGAHVDDLGLLPGSVQSVPTGTTTLRLAPLSGPGNVVRVAKVVEPGSGAYFVQYRTRDGRDAQAWSNYQWGVEVHRENPGAYRDAGSLFLDATPATTGSLERALPPGGTFTSASGKVRVTVVDQDVTGATVQITNGDVPAPPPPPAPPTPESLTISGPGSVPKGSSFTLATTVSDGAGHPVLGWTVRLRQLGGSVVGTAVTDALGQAAVTLTATTSAEFRWEAEAAPGEAPVLSGSARVTVTETAVPSSLSVKVPARVRKGADFKVITFLRDQHAAVLPGWSVTLQRKVQGTTRWRAVRAVTTNARGKGVVVTRTRKPVRYRWVTQSADTALSVTSGVGRVRLR